MSEEDFLKRYFRRRNVRNMWIAGLTPSQIKEELDSSGSPLSMATIKRYIAAFKKEGLYPGCEPIWKIDREQAKKFLEEN